MNVSLTDELERYVNEKVESGKYRSASEVIREGLRLLKEQDERHRGRVEELRREIQVGIDQADRGQMKPFTEEVVEGIKARGREQLAGLGDQRGGPAGRWRRGASDRLKIGRGRLRAGPG